MCGQWRWAGAVACDLLLLLMRVRLLEVTVCCLSPAECAFDAAALCVRACLCWCGAVMAAPASDPKKVFVGQFPKETTEDEIRRLFPGLDVTEIEFAAARS